MLKPNLLFVLAVGCLIGAQMDNSAALPRADREAKLMAAGDKTVMSLFGNKNQPHAPKTNASVDVAKSKTPDPLLSLMKTKKEDDVNEDLGVTQPAYRAPMAATQKAQGHGTGPGTGVRQSQGLVGADAPEFWRDTAVAEDTAGPAPAETDPPAAGGQPAPPAPGVDPATPAAGAGGATEPGAGNGTAGAGGDEAAGGGAVPPGSLNSLGGLPQFVKDSKGNWVYNLWGVTYGKVGQDTRFVAQQTIQHAKVDSNAVKAYYPDGPLTTVCMGASTIYNVPNVKNWLVRKVYNVPIKSRPIWNELRMHIYQMGNSEECHDTTKYKTWREYQECAIRRNMRLESIIPMYPIHQMGSGF